MNQIHILVYAPNDTDRKKLKDAFAAHALRSDSEVYIDWIRSGVSNDELAPACREKELAFIYAGDETGLQAGKTLYAENPSCDLIFFAPCTKSGRDEIIRYFQSLFPSRPVRYCESIDSDVIGDILLDSLIHSSKERMFIRETRGSVYRLPYNEIEYFKSDRNYTYAYTKNKKSYAFPGKLSQIEAELESGFFTRIHQSYLVNISAISMINKSKKSVVLKSGEEIYISRSHYKDILL